MNLRTLCIGCACLLTLSAASQSVQTTEQFLRQELQACPEKAGSSYYAYPGPLQQHYTPVPKGFEPIYISHYGRHGSRLLTEDSRYEEVLKVFDTNELTTYGKDIRARLEKVWRNAKGCGGDLTPVGERQHHDIAVRMYSNYASVFQKNNKIQAVASTSRRCMMSMMAFCEGLKEMNPSLQISRSAHEREMVYINYESPELKSFASKNGDYWKQVLTPFIQSHVQPNRLMKTLFVKEIDLQTAYNLFDGLYWIASDMQNVELGDLSFYDLFTPDELYAYWTCQNLKMYATNGPSPANKGVTAASSRNLLVQMVTDAEVALNDHEVGAHLRFGHDSALIRLLVAMQAGGCCEAVEDDERVAECWQDFRITPMAANLQMIFYRNRQGSVLVKFLLNENEIRLPIVGESGPYYDWQKVKDFWGFKTR